MEQFDVTLDEIKSVLEFAARSLDSQAVRIPLPRLMRVLFDHCTPYGIARFLVGHDVSPARSQMGGTDGYGTVYLPSVSGARRPGPQGSTPRLWHDLVQPVIEP